MTPKIKAILVDDEEKALKSLANKIVLFFPEIEILHLEQNAENAVKIIEEKQPNIVFLDVEMPVLSGFDVLANIKNPDFEIIFVTAYSNYAIEAFQHCAIGYVVKPIDNDELKLAINNALKNIKSKSSLVKNKTLLELLTDSVTDKKMIIPTSSGFSLVKLTEVFYLEGYSGYTKIHLVNNSEVTSSYNIGKFEKMLSNSFFKCHKSYIVNLKKVTAFENEGYLILENSIRIPISRTKRKEIMTLL